MSFGFLGRFFTDFSLFFRCFKKKSFISDVFLWKWVFTISRTFFSLTFRRFFLLFRRFLPINPKTFFLLTFPPSICTSFYLFTITLLIYRHFTTKYIALALTRKIFLTSLSSIMIISQMEISDISKTLYTYFGSTTDYRSTNTSVRPRQQKLKQLLLKCHLLNHSESTTDDDRKKTRCYVAMMTAKLRIQ